MPSQILLLRLSVHEGICIQKRSQKHRRPLGKLVMVPRGSAGYYCITDPTMGGLTVAQLRALAWNSQAKHC